MSPAPGSQSAGGRSGHAGWALRLRELSEFRSWPWRRQRAVLLGLTAACWLVVAFALLWPQWRAGQQMQQGGLQLQQRLEAAQASAAQWADAVALRARQRERAQWWSRRFPAQVDGSAVLRVLHRLADQHQVALQRLRLEPRGDLSAGIQALRLQGHAPFHQWGRFLWGMAQSQPLLRVTELKAQAQGPSGMQVRVAMTVVAQTGPPAFGGEP